MMGKGFGLLPILIFMAGLAVGWGLSSYIHHARSSSKQNSFDSTFEDLKERHENLLTKYHYIKKRDDYLAKRLSKCQKAYHDTVAHVVPMLLSNTQRDWEDLPEMAAPYVGAPLLMMHTSLEIRKRCNLLHQIEAFQKSQISMRNLDEFDRDPFCTMSDDQWLVRLSQKFQKMTDQWSSIDHNNSETLSQWWRERIAEGMVRLRGKGALEQKTMLEMYRSLLKKMPSPTDLFQEVNASLEYWENIYDIE